MWEKIRSDSKFILEYLPHIKGERGRKFAPAWTPVSL